MCCPPGSPPSHGTTDSSPVLSVPASPPVTYPSSHPLASCTLLLVPWSRVVLSQLRSRKDSSPTVHLPGPNSYPVWSSGYTYQRRSRQVSLGFIRQDDSCWRQPTQLYCYTQNTTLTAPSDRRSGLLLSTKKARSTGPPTVRCGKEEPCGL